MNDDNLEKLASQDKVEEEFETDKIEVSANEKGNDDLIEKSVDLLEDRLGGADPDPYEETDQTNISQDNTFRLRLEELSTDGEEVMKSDTFNKTDDLGTTNVFDTSHVVYEEALEHEESDTQGITNSVKTPLPDQHSSSIQAGDTHIASTEPIVSITEPETAKSNLSPADIDKEQLISTSHPEKFDQKIELVTKVKRSDESEKALLRNKKTNHKSKQPKMEIEKTSKTVQKPAKTASHQVTNRSMTKRSISSNPIAKKNSSDAKGGQAKNVSSSEARHSFTSSLAVMPNIHRSKKYEHVQSKVASITDHKPGGGNVKIFSKKITVNASPRIDSLANVNRAPAGGKVFIEHHKIDFKQKAKPRVDARNEVKKVESVKKIPTQKLEWKAEPKIGSLSNITHKPAGGNVKIQTTKLHWSAQSKIRSTENHSNQNQNMPESQAKTEREVSNMPGARDPINAEQALGIVE